MRTIELAPPSSCTQGDGWGEGSPPETASIRSGAALDAKVFAPIRRKLILEACKWDPQVGDIATLAPFPLIVSSEAWRTLSRTAESLCAEALTAEAELLDRPDLWRRLAIPWRIRRALRASSRRSSARERVMRFDFHLIRDGGWRISEVNADVPGGFTEASHFPRLMRTHYSRMRIAGDPAAAWADRIADAASRASLRSVAFLSAPGFMEDHQVVNGLARVIHERHPDIRTHLVGPRQIRWEHDTAFVGDDALGAIVRFYQSEWVAKLQRYTGWQNYFDAGGRTRVVNPGSAILIESKRFPLVWGELRSTHMPTWRRLLPETRDPRDAPWRRDDGWLLKSAFCNTGDAIAIRGVTEPRQWNAAARSASWFPSSWIAQRRFEVMTIDSPMGAIFPCIGVYTIAGRACGAYVRISPRPVIDFAAIDAALLVETEEVTQR